MSIKAGIILTPLNGGTGVAAKPSDVNQYGATVGVPSVGLLETPAVDVGDSFNITIGADIQKTSVPVATAAATAGSWQLEASNDGAAWTVMSTPAAVAVTTERNLQSTVANCAHRFYKGRFIPTGGVAIVGTIQTMGGTVPGAAVRSIAFTPDGLAVGMGVGTAVNFNVWPFAQTTTSLGTAVTATMSGGTPGIGALEFCPNIATKYYALMGGGTTPYASIQPLTLGTLVAGTEIPLPALAGACLDVDWHPTGNFLVAGGTTTPFIRLHHFDPATALLSSAMPLPVIPAVGNVTGVKFSPDGNWLLVVGGTSPYMQIFPVSYSLTEKTISIGTAIDPPTTLPAAALLRCAWHPTGNRFIVVASSTTIYEFPFYRKALQPNVATYGTNAGKIGPIIPTGTVAVAPLNVRYSPDGGSVVFTTGTTAFCNVYPIKDMGSAYGTVQTAITAIASATSYNDFRWSPNMQYVIMGGAGGTAFQQVAPYIKAVQLGANISGR